MKRTILLAAMIMAGCASVDPDEAHADRRQVGLTPVEDPERFIELAPEDLVRAEYSPIANALRNETRYAATTDAGVTALNDALNEKWRRKYGADLAGLPVVLIDGKFYELNYVS